MTARIIHQHVDSLVVRYNSLHGGFPGVRPGNIQQYDVNPAREFLRQAVRPFPVSAHSQIQHIVR
jgi:hypothetical protein